jgi:hypothetical protein
MATEGWIPVVENAAAWRAGTPRRSRRPEPVRARIVGVEVDDPQVGTFT